MTHDKLLRFRALTEKEPANPLHAFAYANVLLQSGDHAAAERAFARCLELDPSWMVAAIRRGRCLVALQRWDEARRVLDLGADLATRQGHDEPFAEIRELLDAIPD